MEKASVLQLLQQAGEAHDAELQATRSRLEQANESLQMELEKLRRMCGVIEEKAEETSKSTLLAPAELALAAPGLLAAPAPASHMPPLLQLGVYFTEPSDAGASGSGVVEKPEVDKLDASQIENESPSPGDASPRPQELCVDIPGTIEEPRQDTLRRGSSAVASLGIFSAVMPGEGHPPRQITDHELPVPKLAQAWRRKALCTSKISRTVSSKAKEYDLREDENLIIRCLNKMVLDPSSGKRILFEVMGLFLIIYDLFWLPMQVFDPPSSTFTEVMGWASSIYWLLDIPMSFLVGQIAKGILEMHVVRVAHLYVRGWFWFDIAVVSVDWVLNIFEMVNNTKNVGGVSALRLGKGVRVLRVFRLIRVLKGGGILQELLDTIHSEHCIIIVGIVKLLGLILCVNHIIACLWFWVGELNNFSGSSWLTSNEIMERSLAYKYSTCLHWSLTQFTPASMEVYPTNEAERIFTVCVIVSAMVIFSSFISAITNAMTQLRTLNKEKSEQFSLLRKYLTQCDVSGTLLARVLQSVSSAMHKTKRRVHAEDLKVLHLLPLSLRQDMNQEVFSPHLVRHAFFAVCTTCFDTYVRKLYSTALTSKFLAPNQELITSGEKAGHMYFVVDGMLNYKSDRQVSPLPLRLGPGSWLAEASLWLTWQHNGHANTATEESDVVAFEATKFQEIFKDDVTVKHYAVCFWNYFMENPADLTDAWADQEFLFDWASSALQTAEKCLGSAIHPDARHDTFVKYVQSMRHHETAMLDEIVQGRQYQIPQLDT